MDNDKILIIVCSKNKAKNDAVINVMQKYFENFEIKSLETNSGVSETTHGMFLCGWTVIYNKIEDEYYYGCSAKVKIPDEIIKKFSKSERLSDIVAKLLGRTEDKISKIGTNGVLTNGEYTRTDEFIDSVKCAISSKYRRLKRNNG